MSVSRASARPRRVRLHRGSGVDYRTGFDWQIATADGVRQSRSGSATAEALALIQHQPVYTLGARGDASNVLVSEAALAARGAALVAVDRGGDVTFHGPGQLVAYPILDLHERAIRPGDYVRLLEQSAIDVLEAFGLDGERVRGRPGVWIDGAKVAAVGVRVQRGVSTHGLALNVDTDLTWFEAIVPCGIADAEVTSMARLLGAAPPFEDVISAYGAAFERLFDSQLVEVAEPSPLVEGRAEVLA